MSRRSTSACISVPFCYSDAVFRRRLTAILAVLAVVILSFLPLADKRILHTKGRLHPWGHLFVFAALTFLVLASARTRKRRLGLMVCMLALPVGIEIAQHFVYSFPIETLDIGVDVVGILCGGAAWVGVPKGWVPARDESA